MSKPIEILRTLAAAEELYRECLKTFGAPHAVTQQALEKMFEAGNEARELLKELGDD